MVLPSGFLTHFSLLVSCSLIVVRSQNGPAYGSEEMNSMNAISPQPAAKAKGKSLETVETTHTQHKISVTGNAHHLPAPVAPNFYPMGPPPMYPPFGPPPFGPPPFGLPPFGYPGPMPFFPEMMPPPAVVAAPIVHPVPTHAIAVGNHAALTIPSASAAASIRTVTIESRPAPAINHVSTQAIPPPPPPPPPPISLLHGIDTGTALSHFARSDSPSSSQSSSHHKENQELVDQIKELVSALKKRINKPVTTTTEAPEPPSTTGETTESTDSPSTTTSTTEAPTKTEEASTTEESKSDSDNSVDSSSEAIPKQKPKLKGRSLRASRARGRKATGRIVQTTGILQASNQEMSGELRGRTFGFGSPVLGSPVLASPALSPEYTGALSPSGLGIQIKHEITTVRKTIKRKKGKIQRKQVRISRNNANCHNMCFNECNKHEVLAFCGSKCWRKFTRSVAKGGKRLNMGVCLQTCYSIMKEND